jgi:hypothetical protein
MQVLDFIGVPEGNRTPDPRFRNHDFAVLSLFPAVQGSTREFESVQETWPGPLFEQTRTGAHSGETARRGEVVTGV